MEGGATDTLTALTTLTASSATGRPYGPRRRGRPARFGVPANQQLRIRVTEDQREALARVARENGTNLADVIREAVNEFVADYCDARPFRGPEV